MRKTDQFRPQVKIFPKGKERIKVIIILLLMIGISIFSYLHIGDLKDTIPIHFNFVGEPTDFGPKYNFFIIIFLMWAIGLSSIFFAKRPYLHNFPVKINESNYEKLYAISCNFLLNINLITTLILSVIQVYIVDWSLGKCVFNIPKILSALIIILIFTTFRYFFKIFRNR